jgi:hypothetical protein
VDRCRYAIVPWLAGGRHGFVELGNPSAIFLVGLVFHPLSDRVQLIGIIGPAKAVADEAKDRIPRSRFDPDDHHFRQQLLLDRKRDHSRVEMAE